MCWSPTERVDLDLSCLSHPNKPQWSDFSPVLATQEAVNLCIKVKK